MLIIEKNITKISELCKKHKVDALYLFGSATNENFKDGSDIDFLVRFEKIDLVRYFDNYITFKEKLNKIFNREIDLVEEQTLKNSILINSINRSKKLIYG
ncbi:MAG: nucleotidyltransferase domain-containing protein [Melioribacteraceae bacterium]